MKDISRPDDVIAIAHGYIAVDEERGSRPVVAIGRNNTTHRFYCACVLNDDGEVVFAQRKIEPIPATVAQG